MGECPQTFMIKARIAPRSGAPAMLHTFASRSFLRILRKKSLYAHVWALGKCPQMLERARHLPPLSSLLYSYFYYALRKYVQQATRCCCLSVFLSFRPSAVVPDSVVSVRLLLSALPVSRCRTSRSLFPRYRKTFLRAASEPPGNSSFALVKMRPAETDGSSL